MSIKLYIKNYSFLTTSSHFFLSLVLEANQKLNQKIISSISDGDKHNLLLHCDIGIHRCNGTNVMSPSNKEGTEARL
jgi:hypothetical protein